MDTLLEQCIEELKTKNIEIKLITKYVDDLFAIIRREDEENILKIFNSYHSKLKFTIEREQHNSIPYLDMKIHRNGNKLNTNWYMKPIASGRLMNYNSTQPTKQKINTITNLINKVFKLSDEQFKSENLEKIIKILTKNNYPVGLINSLIKKVDNKITPRENKENVTSGNPKYYSLPFIPRLTEKNKLKDIIKDEQVTLAHKPNKTLNNLFTTTKTKIKCREQSNVVYEIVCNGNGNEQCGRIYIGTTKRNLGVRIDEHKASIKNKKQATALAQHCIDNEHIPNFEKVKILNKERNENKRYTLESLRIQQKSKSAVNTKEDKNQTNAAYTIAIF